VLDTASLKELGRNLRLYAELDEAAEIATYRPRRSRRRKNGTTARPPECRSHYRITVSYPTGAKVTREDVVEDIRALMEAEPLRHARYVAGVHVNTDEIHGHIWIPARDMRGRKLHFRHRTHRHLDDHWNVIYSRRMGISPEGHRQKKKETTAWKRQRAQGETDAGRPVRWRKGQLAPGVHRVRDLMAAREEALAQGNTDESGRLRREVVTEMRLLQQKPKALAQLPDALGDEQFRRLRRILHMERGISLGLGR
jgi:hypothetical protein